MISGEMHLKNFKSLPHWSCTHYHSQKIQCLFQWGEGALCSPPSPAPLTHTRASLLWVCCSSCGHGGVGLFFKVKGISGLWEQVWEFAEGKLLTSLNPTPQAAASCSAPPAKYPELLQLHLNKTIEIYKNEPTAQSFSEVLFGLLRENQLLFS